jgi:putative transposase
LGKRLYFVGDLGKLSLPEKMIRSPYDAIGRRALPHDPPHFIGTSDAIFFITICCQPKGTNQLCHPKIAIILFDAARFYCERHFWGIPILLLMPDHLHMLACFAPDRSMKKVISNWKRYTTTHARIRWQRDFFDHRLRNDESFHEKANYILQNPMRAGLIGRADDWPYRLQLR